MHLEEMKKEIEAFVVAKVFYSKPEDVSIKSFFGFHRVWRG